jgi:hypothetical protein
MKPFKVKKDVAPGGYTQFWTESKPPVVIVTKFPQPHIPTTLVSKVNPPGKYVQFVYNDVS